MSFPYASRTAKRLRPETSKSPWSRRIFFPAPSRRFRIVLFLIGLIGCLYSVLRLSFRYLALFCSLLGFRFPWFRSLVSLGALRSVCLMAGFPFSSLFFSWWSFRLDKGGRMFRFRLHRRRVLHSALFVLRSGWSSVFLQVVRSFVFPFPLFPMVSVSSSVFLQCSFSFLSSFFLFRLFALGSASSLFCFSSIRPAFPSPHHFIATRHRAEAPGTRHGRGRRFSRRTCRAWRRCRCVSCWRRPCPGPGPA